MPIFEKFKEQRKSGRREEFDEFFRSNEARHAILDILTSAKEEFVQCLRSNEAKQAILDILTSGKEEFVRSLRSNEAKQAILDILTSEERRSILHDFGIQLSNISYAAISQSSAHVQRAIETAKGQFILFLRSDDGKRLLGDLLIEAVARIELAPILKNAETRLKDLAAVEVATLAAHAEMLLNEAAGTAKHRARRAAQDLCRPSPSRRAGSSQLL